VIRRNEILENLSDMRYIILFKIGNDKYIIAKWLDSVLGIRERGNRYNIKVLKY